MRCLFLSRKLIVPIIFKTFEWGQITICNYTFNIWKNCAYQIDLYLSIASNFQKFIQGFTNIYVSKLFKEIFYGNTKK